MKMLGAFISLFSCFFLVVSSQDCPAGASTGCTCSDSLKVKCKDNNQITEIPDWIPNNTHTLEFENCNISFLDRDSFKHLVNLTGVKIFNQNTRSLTFRDGLVFQGLDRLLGVDLDNNNIASLPAGLFANLQRLKILSLNDNPLTNVPADLLQNSPNVQFLYVGETNLHRDTIANIGEGKFGQNIQQLLLSGTYIQRLKDSLFTGLPKLNRLLITNCGINFIGADILKGTELGDLILDGNPIQSIDKNAFEGSKVSTFQCEGCQLTSNVTFNGFLKKLTTLTSLKLQNNSLTHVPKDAFTGLKDLSIIDLSNNLIATFESNPFADLPKCLPTSTTCPKLSNNPFNCDCNLAWLRSFANNIEGDKASWVCAGPSSVAGKDLVSLEIKAFCCESGNTTQCGLPTPDPNSGWIVSAHMMVAILSQIVVMFGIPLLFA